MIQYESLRNSRLDYSNERGQVRVPQRMQCYPLGCYMVSDAIKGILTDASPLCVIHLGLALNSFYRLPRGVEESEEQAASKGRGQCLLVVCKRPYAAGSRESGR